MGRRDDVRSAWTCITRAFLSNELHDRFHEACAAIGLPHPGALKLLLLLSPDEPPPMRDIATLLNCDASWVTSLVDSLEEPGYVERKTSPTDRRIKLVQLTGEGERAREKARAVMSEPPAAFDRLTAQEAATLARLLEKATAQPPPS